MSSDWTHDLVVNHEVLDRQHATLFARLARAEAALDGPAAEVDRALSAFADDLMAHLANEERLMEETLYPDRGRHRSAHEMFVSDLVQLRGELQQKGSSEVVADWIRTRIPEWLRFHIRVNDAPLAAYLSRQAERQGDTRPRRGNGGRPS